MIRAVADTNVIVSAVMFGGLPDVFLKAALLKSFHLITSAVLLEELDEKLRLKFRILEKDAKAIQAKLESVAELVVPVTTLHVIKDDPDDNRVLECAIEGRADFVVSGNCHLLKLSLLRVPSHCAGPAIHLFCGILGCYNMKDLTP